MGDVIDLNVGGVVFTTTLSTLTKYEDSMLGKMFSGKWTLAKDSKGRIFCDRDGSLFRYVMNFLRTDELLIPDDFSELQQLRSEAQFFQIRPLIDAVETEIARKESQDSVRNYSLDIMETGILKYYVIEKKALILCGNLTVIDSLPIDPSLLRYIPRRTDRRGDVVLTGDDYANISLREFKRPCSNGLSRSKMADILLENKCTLLASSSQLKQLDKNTPELQCWDKWLIPEDKLKSLSNLPKYLQ